jgi:pyruvyltransferase
MPFMAEVNLVYYHDNTNHGNFGDELSPYIVSQLLSDKHTLVKNQEGLDYNLLCIGSLLHNAKPNYYIFGTGFGLDDPETFPPVNIGAVRGPLSREKLLEYGLDCPEIYGDAALLLPLYYEPRDLRLQDKVGFVPHFGQHHLYKKFLTNHDSIYLIDPTNHWKQVIDEISSCKSIISQSLHGLVCADAYNIPNVWFAENIWFCNMCHTYASQSSLGLGDEYGFFEDSPRPPCSCGWKFTCWGTNLPYHQGNFKFHDYFLSQNRDANSISHLDEYDESKLYVLGNQIDLESLRAAFPL